MAGIGVDPQAALERDRWVHCTGGEQSAMVAIVSMHVLSSKKFLCTWVRRRWGVRNVDRRRCVVASGGGTYLNLYGEDGVVRGLGQVGFMRV